MNFNNKILARFDLQQRQLAKIEKLIEEINKYNKHTNIVGKSTLFNPWQRHVLDSLQITDLISNRSSSVLDMGTGAGMPGLILAISNFNNVSLIDSNLKKIKFIKLVCLKLNIGVKIYHNRIESLIHKKFDYLISRALANLSKLFFYSHNLINKDTVLIFLKGKQVKNEIHEASKRWKFRHEIYQSISDKRGSVVIIRGLNKING